MEPDRNSRCILLLPALLLGAALLFYPVRGLLTGIYSWQVRTPQSVEGIIGIGIIYLLSLAGVLLLKNRLAGCIAAAFFSLFYLQNHQFLLPWAAGLLYFEMIVASGGAVLKLLSLDTERDSLCAYLLRLTAGIIVWGTAAIVCSLLGTGTAWDFRIMTGVLFVLGLIIKRQQPFTLFCIRRFAGLNAHEKALSLLLLALLLIQGAKSANIMDYDSLWYGFRSDRVLIGDHSFYDNLGMLAWVYYFPKFYELFTAPFCDLGEYSFIHAVGVMLLGCLICAIYRFMRELGLGRVKALFYTALTATIPTISNFADVAKPDMFSTLFTVMSALCMYKAFSEESPALLLYASAMLALALGGKINSYLYAFTVFAGGALALIVHDVRSDKSGRFLIRIFSRKNAGLFILFFMSLFVLFGVTLRTYLLTGYPLYPFTVNFWKKLGFEGVYPFAEFFGGRSAGFYNVEDFNLRFYLKHAFNLLFAVTRIDEYRQNNIAQNWYGNIAVLLMAIDIILIIWRGVSSLRGTDLSGRETFAENTSVGRAVHKGRSRRKKRYRLSAPLDRNLLMLVLPTWTVMICVAVFKFQYAHDGNYYMIPVVLGVICFGAVFEGLKPADALSGVVYYGVFTLHMVIQFIIMFSTSFSWVCGTSELGFNIFKSQFDSQYLAAAHLAETGLTEIEEYISGTGYEHSRALGNFNNEYANCLSTGIELTIHANPHTSGIFDTREHLLYYLDWADINFLIVSNDPDWHYLDVFEEVFEELKGCEGVVTAESDNYTLIDITELTCAEGSVSIY